MTDGKWVWVSWDTPAPTQPGWYAVLQCWDMDEGLFPGAYFSDGSAWLLQDGEWRHAIVGRSVEVFQDKAAADAWADRNDPDGPGEGSGACAQEVSDLSV